ncbi:MAG: hypothetical protein LUG85_03105 [Clostridiales bacterium]|nr:hypothetical protein [Clostridiales bacterium]
MKIARKTLSVFLSFLMMMSACSVAFTGLSFSAAVASSYSVSDVKTLVSAASSAAASTSSSSNSWSYTGDDGSVLAAAEAVYDYAVNSVRVTDSTGNYNSSDTLYERMISSSVLNYGSSTSNAKLVQNLIYPTGTSVYGYEKRTSTSYGAYSGSWEGSRKYMTSSYYDYSVGDDVTTNSNVTYNSNVSTSTVIKTSSVTVDVDSYLLTLDSIDDVPSSFNTKVTYKYTHTYSRSATITSRSHSGNIASSKATYNYTSYIWNYLSSTSRTVNSTNTTARSTLDSYANYFTDERLATTVAELLANNTAAELQSLYNEAYAMYYTTMIGSGATFSTAVINHFFDTSAIVEYIANVEFAMQVALAQVNMQIMLDCINDGYDVEDIDDMTTVYTTAKNAYDIISEYDDDVFAYVVANYDGFDDFSLAASEEFLDELYYQIELYQLRVLKAAIDADIAANEQYLVDPEDTEDITDLELAALADKFTGYKKTLSGYSSEAIAAVFTDGTSYIDDFRSDITLKINTRDAQVEYTNWYTYFLPYIFANITLWTNEEIMTRYTEDSAEYKSLVSDYNSWVKTIGSEIASSVFTLTYNDEDTLLTDAVDDYLARLKTNIQARNDAQLETIKEYKDMSTTIDFSNFIGVKTAVDRFDQDLYDYAVSLGVVDSTHKSIYNSISSLLTAYNKFVASGGLPYTQAHYHDSEGVYVTRYAGDQTNSSGEQIGYENDLARDNEDNDGNGEADDNYVVDEAAVSETIVKLDNFITSEDFSSLVGLEDEDGNAYGSLSEAIEDILVKNIFTNDMVNMLVGALFPMICELIEEYLDDLSTLGVDMLEKSSDSNASAYLNLTSLGISFSGYDLTGGLDIYMGGYNSTETYAELLSDLGAYIYPSTFATYLSSNSTYKTKYASIITALNQAGTDWTKLVGSDGETDITFDWGVTDYSSFTTAMGAVFGSLGDLLQTILVGKSYSKTTGNNAANIKGSVKLSSDSWYLPTLEPNVDDAYAKAIITIEPLTLFKDLWVPVLEACGIDSSDITVPSSSASTATIVKNMFDPIMTLIETLANAPIETLCDMLPQLFYALSMDKMQDLIDSITLTVTLEFEATDIDVTGQNVASTAIYGLLEGVIQDVINDNIPALDFSIGLDILNLKDMLGFEYTNINTLLDYIFEALGYDLQLPIMNVGEIIVCSSYSYVTSKRSSGTRLKLEADTTDVFYVILKYLVNAVGDTDFMQNIVAFIQNMDSDDGGSAVELPDIVYTIIGNVNSSADDALAALVELFCPQVYDTAEYEWYESAYTYNEINGTSAESIVYLTYGNDWTADKANYFVENVDDLLQTVLEMAGTEVTDINVWLQEAISGLFNNENLTGVVKGLATLGVMFNSDFLYDLIADQTNVDLRTWYNAFGYLFSDIDEEYGTTAVAPGETGYSGIDGITATAAETVNAETGETETTVTWYIDGVEFEDGNREQFLKLFCSICSEMAPLISMFFTGEDMTLFAEAITITGYGSYANSVGLVFEMLGIEGVLDQDEYVAKCNTDGDAAAFEYLCNQLFDWLDDFLDGNTVKNIIDLLPNLVYFIESNGLYTMLHNLLMPLLVLVDDIRPILDIDLNAILSVILSDLLNYGTLDLDNLLNLLAGTYEDPAETDPDYKYYEIDISDLTLDSIIKLIDQYLGTNFYDSQLVSPGLDALCAGRVEYDSVIGTTAYYTSMSTADALTITLSAVLESLEFVVDESTGETNGDIICALIDSMLDEPVAADVYAAVVDLIGGIDAQYADINWDYMFDIDDQALEGEQITLPEHSIVYLGYSTDWTEETADAVDSALDAIIDLVLDSVADGQTIAQLINSVLNDNVYSDANLDAIVELIANAIGGLDSSLYKLVDVVIDTDIAGWFTMCEETTDENGDTVFVCTYDWGIDDAETEEKKKDLFISGLCTTLEPAEQLIAWLMFGDDYAFFTGTEVDADGNYILNDIITISGGRGYDLGIVPLLEALGCEVKGAKAYYDDVNGTYDVTGAVSDVINSIFTLVDEISGEPATEAFDLLANLIYFINADGLKVCMSNLLLPVDSILETLSPLVSSDGEDVSIGALLEDALGFNICDLTMENLLTLASDAGFVMSSEMVQILCTFYIGELQCFSSANGNYAYRMVYTDEESRADMLTIVLSFAVEAFKLNADLFSELLGEETYNAVMEIISGVDEWFYADPNWAYAYGDDEDALAQLAADGLPERTEENSIVYTQYTNNWNKVTSDYLDDNLTEIICMITDLITDDGSSLGTLLDDAISGGLYQDSILNSMIELVVGLIVDFDEDLVNAVGAVIGVDIEDWFDYCTFSEDADGNTVVTCDYDWGIDSQTTNEAKKEAFVAAFVEALEPANRLIDWLFFGDSYTFFNSSTGDVLITIAGGEGYNYAIVPILEALGCEPKAASEYQNADGSYNTSEAVADVFTALTDFLSDICGDLENAQNGGAVEAILDVLPNIVYFVNADGLSVAVQNLLIPVTYILDALEPVGVEVDLNELVGIDLGELNFSLVFDILESSLGIYLPETVQTFISTFYMGAVEDFTSANGRTAYRMVYTEDESRAEMTTILISIVLEAFKYEDNETVLKDLLGDYYEPILAILQGAESDFDYEDPNWAYMYDGDLDKLIADNLPGHSDEDQNSIVYTQYTNNWNEETADYLDENLSEIIQMIVDAVRSDGSTVGELLDAAITDGLYQDKILNALLEEIVKLLAGLDSVLVGAIGAVLDVNIDTWFDYCTFSEDADGNTVVTCTKDWGIDSKTTNEEKKEAFVAAFVEALEPANQLLAWLFFGEDYTFFNSSTGEDLITISGGEGYDYAIVPILEALGCTMGYSNETGIKPASAYYDDVTGSYDVTQAVEDVFTSLTDLLSDICGDLATGEDALDVMLELLPNVVYFINADGVKNSVNNLLAPVYYLLEVLTPLTGEINLDDLINFPLSDITFYAIFDILEDRLGLHIDAELQEFVATFYMGEVESFTSAVDSKTAYRMVYSEDESRADMITILISLVLDVFKDSANESVLSGWLGSDNYTAVVKLLSLTEAKAMQDFSWYYTEYADTDETFSAIETSTLYTDTYNEYWTQEKAQYIADNLEAFIGNTLCLLGLEIDGVEIESLDDIMDALVSGSLYTQDNADAIISLLSDLMAQISELEPYGQYIGDVLDSAFGIDITAWDNMTVTVTDGDRESFEDALVTILAPIAPLFKVLLAGEDISFFLDFGGNDQIIIPGSEGYAYGIIPLLEALGCDNILTPDEFKALLASDEEAAIKAVIDPLFNKVDDIMADPVDEILELLPPVIYFINSNGLDTCVKNILNSVDTVIEALEPIIGETDIMSLLGVNLSTYDFEWIVNYALDAVYESTGYDLTPVVMDAISELTVGKVVTYESKNGETYYTMVYDADLSKADMVTIVLRIAIDFITMDENIEKIEGILAEYIPDEDNYKAACSLIESLAEKVKEDPGMGQALYVLYYIYYGISTSLEFTDDVYHDVNNSWQFILKLLSDSDEPILSGFSTTLQNVLNTYFDGIFDSEGIASDGAVTFFQKIIAFFQKIIDFFKNLFGIE